MNEKYYDYYSLEYSKKKLNYGGESTLHLLDDREHVFKRFRSDLGSKILNSKERNLDELLKIDGLDEMSLELNGIVVTWEFKGKKLIGTIMPYVDGIITISLTDTFSKMAILNLVKEAILKLEALGIRHFDLKIDNIIVTNKKPSEYCSEIKYDVKIGDMDAATVVGVKSDYSNYNRLQDYMDIGGKPDFHAEIFLFNKLTQELLFNNLYTEDERLKQLVSAKKINDFCFSLNNDNADQIGDHEFLIDHINEYAKTLR